MSADDFIDPNVKIEKLRNDISCLSKLTQIFVMHFVDRNEDRFKSVSTEAFQLLVDITCEMLPHANIRADVLERGGNGDWAAFGRNVAIWVGPLSASAQKEKIFNLPQGQVKLPYDMEKYHMSLIQTIQFMYEAFSAADSNGIMALYGYRVEGEDDFLVFSIDRSDDSSSGVFEVSMMTLCKALMEAVDEI